MNDMETLRNKKWLLQKLLVSDSKQTSSTQYRSSKALAVMDNIETFHHKKIVAAENVGFRFEADFFQWVPMITGLVVMDNIEMFHHKKMVAAENDGFTFKADPQNQYRLS